MTVSVTALTLILFLANARAAGNHIGLSSPDTRYAFQEYLAQKEGAGYKVFMLAVNGAYAWAARRSYDSALKMASDNCRRHAAPRRCELYAVGDTVVWGLSKQEQKDSIAAYKTRVGVPEYHSADSLPEIFTVKGAEAFTEYKFWKEGPNLFKVFVLSHYGAWSWNTDFSYEQAEREAIELCEQARHSRRGSCRPYAIGDTIVWEKSEKETRAVASAYKSSKTFLGTHAVNASLGFKTVRAFRTYQLDPDFKFFAVGNNAWGKSDRASFDLALEEAMSVCKKYAGRPCELFAVGDTVVWKMPENKLREIMDAYKQR
ncbi:MAG TPA: hypothetical protein VLS27_05890 [Gammaproteobacteria bacterium]|nr:hypothetical protein [Gammaproteobacteria bacterium]